MRLICPNCDAQYEVPVEVIPAGGRDVQCSNCANTWYQNHPDDDPVLSEEPDPLPPEDGWNDTEETLPAEPVTPEPPIPEPPVAERHVADPPTEPSANPPLVQPDKPPLVRRDLVAPRRPVHSEYDDDGDNAPADAPALPPREAARARSLDPSVAEVLRQEAARENRQRAAEFSSLESQPDLGLDAPPSEDDTTRRARESRDRKARMRGETASGNTDATRDDAIAPAPSVAIAPATATNSRRDLLPDVEEINQTLRSTRERREVETLQGRALMRDDDTGGFGRGFVAVLMLGLLLAAFYIFAPQISDMVPATEPLFVTYVSAVDQLRLWLDAQVTALLLSLDGLSSEADAPDS